MTKSPFKLPGRQTWTRQALAAAWKSWSERPRELYQALLELANPLESVELEAAGWAATQVMDHGPIECVDDAFVNILRRACNPAPLPEPEKTGQLALA